MNSQRNFVLYYATILLLLHCYVTMSSILNITTDQSALLSLKNHISHDPNNILSKNWSSNTPVCNWIGITCGSSHLRVTSLNLSYMGLVGTLHPHLGSLSFLSQLILRNNSFHGNLPYELSSLRRLKIISLRSNNLSGKIPSWFSCLPKLEVLVLAWNSFTGKVPDYLFNSTTLQFIDLSGNNLWGCLPSNMFVSPSLEYLSVSDNGRISGAIPSTIVVNNYSSLQVIGLGGNNLSGEVPEHLFRHFPKLEELYLHGNMLSGEVPNSLLNCKELRYLALSQNSFSGSIPRWIGNLTGLKEIYLAFNSFRGSIPYEIGNLHNLEALTLHFNDLSGNIPPTIFNFSSIKVISVTGNSLSGSLPTNIGSMLPKLERLYMGINYFNGRIPSSLCNSTLLSLIDFPANLFSGYIPDTFDNLRSLKVLNLDQNNLTGDPSSPELSIINSLTNCRFLTRLSLAHNPLNSILPISLGNLSTYLVYLELTGCSMRGSIPASIGNLTSLISLALDQNQFVGTFPIGIWRLLKLQGLSLNMNQLEGFVPHELCQLKSLYSLTIESNMFSGPIPSCLSNLTSLRKLSISSNSFTSIPSTLWGLADLFLLDLSSNNLRGSLSIDVGNLKALTWFNLSGNQFSGSIPSSIGNLELWVYLSLARNEFHGPIPESFGRIVSLELLDLSENNLSGVIPVSLESLVHLKYFNVSSNKLKGEIPNGGPFVNFSAQSFMGNEGLCGAPHLQFPECKKGKSQKVIPYIVLKYILPATVATILVLALLCVLKCQKRKVLKNSEADQPLARWRRISHYEIQQATNSFNDDNLLGIGSFGKVYKGVLSDGMNVAIKVFNLGLEEEAFKSFDTECEVLCNVRHRNLTKIISCCSNIDFKALVISYMSNGSLEKWLHSENYSLSMIQRLNIMTDVAEAMDYLHHGGSIPIVHCDLKHGNVVLDEEMVAHVTDFGIAKLLSGENSITQTLTLATMGYMAPEYGLEGSVSREGDVYSFGILLMETFTKRKPTDEMFMGEFSIKHWVNMSYLDSLIDIIDAKLLPREGELATKQDCLSSIMKLALECSAESPRERINMRHVLVTLKKIKRSFLC